jgi:hypothetical protein
LLPSIQVIIRAGRFPAADGVHYLTIPVKARSGNAKAVVERGPVRPAKVDADQGTRARIARHSNSPTVGDI